MTGPAGNDDGVRSRRRPWAACAAGSSPPGLVGAAGSSPPGLVRRAGSPRPAAGPAALALLAAVLLAGCGSAAPSGHPGPAAAGGSEGGQPRSPAGSRPATTVPRSTASRFNSMNKTSDGQATPAGGGSTTAPRSGCTRWPAGSTGDTLLITQASNGRQYCVQPGQSVQVYLGGVLSPKDGSEPPRLTGSGLVAAPSGQAHLLRAPAATYQAVRAAPGDDPGRAVLTIVRLPCHSIEPTPTPAAGPAGASSLGDPGAGAGVNAVELADRGAGAGGDAVELADRGAGAGAGAVEPADRGAGAGVNAAELADRGGAPVGADAVELADRGGAPVGAQCALQQALRVTVVVP
ncbi:MAG: hypothetical protein JO016_04710 [Actinobacteria bacterium]|nr:hypothetical protein [Actinomycetota bacterium]